MRTPCSPRIAPCDLCEPLKKHRRRKDMQREPKAQRGSSKDYASASNARPRSDDRNSRPEGKTSPRRRGRIPTRNKPSRRTQGMPQPPPCARKRIRPTTPGQSTLSPATHSPRRRHGAAPEENPRPSPYFGGSFRWPRFTDAPNGGGMADGRGRHKRTDRTTLLEQSANPRTGDREEV